MPKFIAKMLREFEAEITADTIENAEGIAKSILEQIPDSKLLSILPEGYVEPTDPEKPIRPGNKPVGGGSPGTPTVSVPVLVDQIAKVA